MDDVYEVYQVYNMHGPTIYHSTHAGFEKLCEKVQQMSKGSGPYSIKYLPTGETVAVWDVRGEMTLYKAQGGKINESNRS